MNTPHDTENFKTLIDVLARRYKSQVESDAVEHRVVLVIGAGVSSGSGLPLWSNPALKKKVLLVAEGHYGGGDRFVEAVWDRLGPRLGLPPTPDRDQPTAARDRVLEEATLDELCAVACDDVLLRDRILAELVGWFAPWPTADGPPPQLAYELIAHLLKHRFIDHIVSFNFDELLDTAVANELAAEDYVRITSDHHVLAAEDQNKPHIIKAHGTISAPETLRFTVPQTGALTHEMVRLLDRTICTPPQSGQSLKLDIISLGYSWQDTDFAHYIYKHRADIDNVIVMVATSEHTRTAMIRPEILYARTKTPPSVGLVRFVNSSAFSRGKKSNGKIPSVDLMLWAVCNALTAKLTTNNYPVIPIARHLILAALFTSPNTSRGVLDWIQGSHNTRHTRENRFRAELLLHIIECKGMVNVSVMAHNCRLKRYRPAPPGQGHDFLGTFDFLKRSLNGDVKETYYAKVATLKELCSALKSQFSIPSTATVVCPNSPSTPAPDFQKCVGNAVPLDDFLDRNVEEVFDGEEVEVVPSADPRSPWVFTEPKALPTYLTLQKQTEELLHSRRRRWTHLFVVAETGAWMTSRRVKSLFSRCKEKRCVLCIDTHTPPEWGLRDEIAKRLAARRRPGHKISIGACTFLFAQLEWWEHNRHLTLGYNANDSSFTGGIFFRRSLRSTQITPVYVHHPSDCAELFLTFLSYALRVCQRKEQREESLRNRCLGEFLRILTGIASSVGVPGGGELRNALLERLRQYQNAGRQPHGPEPHPSRK